MTNNEPTKNLNAMKELDEKVFRQLVSDIKDARKSADQLLALVKEKKDALIALRVAREAEEAERSAREAKAAAEAEEQLVVSWPEEEPVQQEEPKEEPAVQEEAVQESEQPETEAVKEEEAKPAEEVTPAPKEEPKIFIPQNSTIKSKEQLEKERISAYRAQNVQEPRKFVPPTPKKKEPAPRGNGPQGKGESMRQQPVAGTTFVPQNNNRRSQPVKKNFDRDFDDKKGGKRPNRRELMNEEVSDAELNRRYKSRKGNKTVDNPQLIKIEHAVVSVDPVPIKLLAEKIGKPSTEIVKKLLLLGTFKNINDSIDFEEAELLALDFGVTLELKLEETMEDKLSAYIEQTDLDSADQDMQKRAPVVTIMGHVDHGKTSLLDYIRHANVAGGEAGGITQHIGAYTIRLHGEKITFIDTPGHEAFTTMRARGAQVTDIAVIVVAADDSIMPQTVESINHAKAAKVPIIVAINKIDKMGANIDKVKNDLAKYDLLIEEWGGDTIAVPVSAKTGEGVETLLEQILLVAEVSELKANPKTPARGTIIEARLDKNVGPVATVLVQGGTLKVGDNVVAGSVIGKVKMMKDDKGNAIKSAGPSIPVSVLGFDSVPNAGDQVVAVEEKFAKSIAEERKVKERIARLSRPSGNLEDLFKEMTDGKMKELNLIIKADVQGSVEALAQELKKLANEEVKVNIIHSAVGAVNESDVILAATSGAVIIAFNVRPDSKARDAAAKEGVDIRTYSIIYDVIDQINLALKGMLAPKFREVLLGHAEVRNTFHISSVGTIAGCYVTDGKVARNSGVRLLRDNIVVYEGKISSLKRMKDDAKEVLQGFECGVGLEKYNDIKVGDVIESYVIEQVEA